MEIRCKMCGGKVEKPAKGRTPDYCSTECRRAAEYERRKNGHAIEPIEVEAAPELVGTRRVHKRADGTTRSWHVEVYTGECLHEGRADLAARRYSNAVYCPGCGASQGPDGIARVLIDD